MINLYKKLSSVLIGVLITFAQLTAQDQHVIKVSGTCGMCKDRIEDAAVNVIGVSAASYDIEKQELTVDVQSVFQKKELVDALLAVGHDADGQVSSEEAYNVLPDCCKYKAEETEHTDHDGHDHDNISKNVLTGTVFEKTEKGAMLPLIGANIRWKDGNGGTTSDLSGEFSIPTTIPTFLPSRYSESRHSSTPHSPLKEVLSSKRFCPSCIYSTGYDLPETG